MWSDQSELFSDLGNIFAGIDFSRQNLTTKVYPRTVRVIFNARRPIT